MTPWLGIAFIVLLLDQITKITVNKTFRWGEEVVVTPFFNLVLAYNRGAAFSFLQNESGWQRYFFTAIGIGAAFLFGLLMDVHQGSVLGQHALAYSVLNFLAIAIHRRLLWFTLLAQSLHVLPLLIAAHLVALAVRLMVGGHFPGFALLLGPSDTLPVDVNGVLAAHLGRVSTMLMGFSPPEPSRLVRPTVAASQAH
eukprot:gene1812-2557_t